MSRGQGRVFQPVVTDRREKTAIWWLDYTVNGKRYRESSGTTDYTEALDILKQRREDRRIGRPVDVTAQPTPTTLQAYVAIYLKKKEGKVTEQSLLAITLHLKRAVEHFGAERQLASIRAKDVREWDAVLATRSGDRRSLAGGPRRQHLNSLSNLFRYAREDEIVPSGYDPVGDMTDKPTGAKGEARWLEVDHAALFLEAAKRYVSPRPDMAVPFAYELIATMLLTGGRPSEVTALTVGDVNLSRDLVTIRGTKTANAVRVVPLWPQLAAILRPYIAGKPPEALLFPTPKDSGRPLKDLRKMLDGIVTSTEVWKAGEIHPYIFRHTYCAARLQTLDGGAPVSAYTVGKEMGHGGDALVRRVYGHLGTVRHRSAAVEFRVEQHHLTLRKHISRLQWGRLPFERQTKVEQQNRRIA
jgi:integrase